MLDAQLFRLSAQILTAHGKHNAMPAAELPALIDVVYTALKQAADPVANTASQKPAVPIKKSVFPDYIICLEDGQKLKMLKRRLMAIYGMTPKEYRAKWGLPASYPMVAPDYAKRRSVLAKGARLGGLTRAAVEDNSRKRG